MKFNKLTDEQKAKARACASEDELIALAKAEGVELTDEQLEGVTGGWGCSDHCPDDTYTPLQ